MNKLSLLLYLAGVAGTIKVTTGLILFAASAAGCIGLVAALCSKYERHATGEFYEFYLSKVKLIIVSWFVAATILCIVPGRDTIYAIAVSEMGEDALKTETANKAVAALNRWLDKQLAEEPAK